MSVAGSPRAHAVLVHGIMDTGRIFRSLMRTLDRAGIPCIAPSLTPSDGSARLEVLAEQLADTVERELPTDAPLHIVGFSMGALVSRYFIQFLGGHARTRGFFSVSAPHAGSWWCSVHPLAGARQMRPGSAFLERLDADLSCFERIPTVAYWTPFDLVILPPRSGLLAFAENVRVAALCHPCMLRHPRVHSDIRKRMLEAPGAQGSEAA